MLVCQNRNELPQSFFVNIMLNIEFSKQRLGHVIYELHWLWPILHDVKIILIRGGK